MRARQGANGTATRYRKRQAGKEKASRASGADPAKWIRVDSRGSDRKKGLDNDLTYEFVREMILRPCSYCGDTESRMTLDRIDNDLGHLQSNVVPSCYRCNFIRRDIPYEAWIVIAPGVKAAREGALFGAWVGGTKKPT